MTAARKAPRETRPALTVLDECERLAQACRANLLIVGRLPATQREDIVRAMQARCELDVVHAQRRKSLELPTREVVLVVDDACRLSLREQGRLLRWIGQHKGQITSFASRSLYGMVCEGQFIEALYYHLNTVCVVLTAP